MTDRNDFDMYSNFDDKKPLRKKDLSVRQIKRSLD